MPQTLQIHTPPQKDILLDTNSICMVLLGATAVLADQKQIWRPAIDVMFYPWWLAVQQAPKFPAAFAEHSFCNAALNETRLSPAAKPRTVTRSRNEEGERKCFMSWVVEK